MYISKIISLLIIAILPIIIFAYIIYSMDKNKEPKKYLLFLFVLGMISCLCSAVISNLISFIVPTLSIMEKNDNKLILLLKVFINIAIIEEGIKWFTTFFTSFNNKNFDELYDIIVYSVFVSLGFSFLENIYYVFSYGYLTGLFRAIFTVPTHICCAIFMGYYIGYAKIHSILNNKKKFIYYLLLSIISPIIIHGIYDYCLLTGNIYVFYMFQVVMVIIYNYSIKKINRLIKINKTIKLN